VIKQNFIFIDIKNNELTSTNTCTMKKLFLLLFAFLTIGAVSHAQQGGGRGMSPEAMIDAMKDSLNLSNKQVDSIKVIFKEFLPKQMEIRQDQEMSRDDKMAKMKELNEARNARIKAVLTDEQFKKYQEMEERRRQRMQQGAGRGGN
jgi:periplasmic protein CpxP/Spy